MIILKLPSSISVPQRPSLVHTSHVTPDSLVSSCRDCVLMQDLDTSDIQNKDLYLACQVIRFGKYIIPSQLSSCIPSAAVPGCFILVHTCRQQSGGQADGFASTEGPGGIRVPTARLAQQPNQQRPGGEGLADGSVHVSQPWRYCLYCILFTY